MKTATKLAVILRDISGLIKSSLNPLQSHCWLKLSPLAPGGSKGISTDPGSLAAVISKLANQVCDRTYPYVSLKHEKKCRHEFHDVEIPQGNVCPGWPAKQDGLIRPCRLR